ncbi:MAG: PQQ-binding-like beta-propeller repeat protein [Proteobacteria bacterium]|nr:PQQ-binding-like beta-propeller repeat protein [Pseudomonadota bacterium]
MKSYIDLMLFPSSLQIGAVRLVPILSLVFASVISNCKARDPVSSVKELKDTNYDVSYDEITQKYKVSCKMDRIHTYDTGEQTCTPRFASEPELLKACETQAPGKCGVGYMWTLDLCENFRFAKLEAMTFEVMADWGEELKGKSKQEAAFNFCKVFAYGFNKLLVDNKSLSGYLKDKFIRVQSKEKTAKVEDKIVTIHWQMANEDLQPLFEAAKATPASSLGISGGYPNSFTSSLNYRSPAVVPANASKVVVKAMFEAGGETSKAAILSDGTVVVGSWDNNVYWLKDGIKIAEYQTEGRVTSCPAVLSDGTVVVGSNDKKVYWLKDGKKVAEFQTGGKVDSSPAILNNETVVVGSNDNKVYWLKDGKKIGEFAAGNDLVSSPAVLSDETVVVGSLDKKVYWLKDGNNISEFQTSGIVYSSPAILRDGIVVVGTWDKKVLWLKDGKKIAEFQVGGWLDSSAAILSDETVVVGSRDKKVYWLKDGKYISEYLTEGDVNSSPAVLSDGTLVIGSSDKKIYWLKEGKMIAEYKTGGAVSASPAILNDGTVVIGSNDNKIYWLKLE